jgi:hypothetical protein
MTVASLEALALHKCLRGEHRDLAQRYFDTTAKQIQAAWDMATGSDLALPAVQGTRTFPIRLTTLLIDGILTAAEVDILVAEQFWKVINLIDPPTSLMHPALLLRVAASRLRRLQSRLTSQVLALHSGFADH